MATPTQPATRLTLHGVRIRANGIQNVLRVSGLEGSGSQEIYAALAGAGIVKGPKESAAVVNALIQRAQSISRFPIVVSLRESSVRKIFPFTAEIEWRGELSEE